MTADRTIYSVTWGYDDEGDRAFYSADKARAWAANSEGDVTIVASNPAEGWSRDITSDWFPGPDDDEAVGPDDPPYGTHDARILGVGRYR